MELTKIIKEVYLFNRKYEPELSPGKKIKKRLESYSIPNGANDNLLDIPSIPGGRIYFEETVNATGPQAVLGVRLEFYHLDNLGLEKEDKKRILEVRKILYKEKPTKVYL